MTRTQNRICAAGLMIAVLLAALFVFSPRAQAADVDVWNGDVAAKFAGGTGTKDDPFIISNGAELAYFSESVKSNYYENQYVSLTADIDLGNKPWTPIGNNGNFFVGVFEGNGHTVSHVNVNLNDTKEVGLFGKTGTFGAADGGTIKNLTVRDSTITGTGTECEDVGAVAGYAQIVINCQSINNVVTGVRYVGGVCGQVSGSISRCYNTSSVTGEDSVGGVFGAAILSSGAGYTVEECYNAGSVTGTVTNKPVGGVGGIVEYRATSDCLNTGDVTAVESSKDGNGVVVSKVGGAFGWLKELSAARCVSTGNVLGDTYAGAVVGYLSDGATITDFYYNSETCSLDNGNGTGLTAEGLSGALPANFSEDAWNAGGERIRETVGRHGVREICYISLKNVGEPSVVSEGTPVYNFSVDDTKDWQEYTPINNEEDFLAIGTDSTKWKGNFVLTQDLNLSGKTITPIGESLQNNFSGRFSGDRHVISNVQINSDDNAGLFGYVRCGTVMLLGVDGDISGSGPAGGICGNGEGASIYGCYFTGTISGYNCGGIVPFNTMLMGKGVIKDCYASAVISAEANKGGITASINTDFSVTNCYYDSSLCMGGRERGTALTTLEMLSSDALKKMPTTENLWVKKANDKENHIAYYPSFSEDNAAAVSYTTGLSFVKQIPTYPVYGDTIGFIALAELRFDGNDKPVFYDDSGDFSIKLGENTVATGNNYALSWIADCVGDITLTLVYNVSGSEFFPEESTKDLVISVDKKELTAADIAFEPPASLTFDGNEHPAGLTANVKGAGELIVTYCDSDGELLESAPVNAGSYTVKVSAAEGEFYKAASGLTDGGWEFAIAKAAAPKINEGVAKFSYAATGEKSVPAAGLPENMGAVGEVSLTFTGDDIGKDIIVADSLRYSDGRVYFTLAEDKAMNRYGYINVTVPSQNYEDISFRVCILISSKEDIEAPASGEFSLVLTNDGSDITASIETELSGVEFSFDGTTWSTENTVSVGHGELVTGYVRYAETEDYNASPAASMSLNSGHGTLAHCLRAEPSCTRTGNVEYWECELCKRYFLDENGKTEVTAESVVLAKTEHTKGDPVKENAVPATCTVDGSYDLTVYCTVCSERISSEHITEPAPGHSWSEEFESDKDGHWHKCVKCGAASEKQAHRSGDPVKENAVSATCTTDGSYDMAVYCTVCGERVSFEHITEPALGHSWSEDFESDKDGHWHRCGTCGAVSDKEAHRSSGPATYNNAEVCTVCGYVISPKKTSGGGSSGGSGASYRPTAPAADTNPAINGTKKSWADIAADLSGQNGGSAVISLNGETAVPAEVIKAIAEKKLKVEFVIDSTRSWLVDGAKIAAASAADFSILPGNTDRSALRGVLGANMKISGTNVPADLKLSFRREFAGQFANVYRLADGRLEFQGCVRLGEDGSAIISGAYPAGGYVVMVCGFSDLPGDVTNDGVLNALDAAAVLKSIVGISEGANPLMGDFNGDGAVNALDASAILKHLVSAA